MQTHKLIDVVGVNADGTPFSGQMYEVSNAVSKDTPLGTKWGFCSVCLTDFPLKEMMLVKGKYYCRKYKCYQDTMAKEIQS